jgi:hypothetical protein
MGIIFENGFNLGSTNFAVSPTPTPSPSSSAGAPPSPTPTVTPTATVTPTQSSLAASPTPTPTPSNAGSPSGLLTIYESGSNVIMSVSGTIDLSGLTLIQSGTTFGGATGGIGPSSATYIMARNSLIFDTYSGFTTTPTSFGTGGGASATSSTGNIFGVIYESAPPYQLVVPSGYTSGAQITSTQTFTGQTLTSLGLTSGTYTYTWGSGKSFNVAIGGPAPTPTPSPSVGSNAGVGSWYFYSDEGTINVGPPISNGNALFTIQGSPILETYNPNENSGTSFLYFALNDNTGTNYGTQFSGLTPGGTISIIQNNKKATYTGGSNSFMVVNDGLGNFFFMINTAVATQAVNASSSFVFGDPISITFGS